MVEFPDGSLETGEMDGDDPSRARTFRSKPELIVDDTGVGRAVADLVRARGLKFIAVTITGGDEVHAVGGGHRGS